MFNFRHRQKVVSPAVLGLSKVIPLVFCAVCKKPLSPGAPVLELRNGYLANNQTTDKMGFLATGVFIHTANTPQSCLTEYTLDRQVEKMGLNLEKEDLSTPRASNPTPKTRRYVEGVIPVIPISVKLEEAAPASLRVLATERRRSSFSSLDD